MSGQFDATNEHNGTGRALVLVRDGNADATAGQDRTACGPAPAMPPTEIGFLAQLLACRHGVSAYRRHRREEPAVAIRRYRAGAVAGEAAMPPSRTVRLA